MEKANVFRSSKFYMWAGDVLHMILLDESGVPVTVNLVSVTTPEIPDAGTPLPPVATAGTLSLSTSFIANWGASTLATKYYLDVATDLAFTSFVAGYNNKDVGSVLTYTVTGLPSGTTAYYYRVRAYNTIGTSDNSNTITTGTFVYSDWFLPSKDELNAMKVELDDHGLGNFDIGYLWYWSSSEFSAGEVWIQMFTDGTQNHNGKIDTLIKTRACRSFTSTINYNLRDIGQAGGYVFWKSGNNYLESAPIDQSASHAWSNITGVAVTGTGTAIGTGQANTTAIINQIGHADSVAKLCNDLVI